MFQTDINFWSFLKGSAKDLVDRIEEHGGAIYMPRLLLSAGQEINRGTVPGAKPIDWASISSEDTRIYNNPYYERGVTPPPSKISHGYCVDYSSTWYRVRHWFKKNGETTGGVFDGWGRWPDYIQHASRIHRIGGTGQYTRFWDRCLYKAAAPSGIIAGGEFGDVR